MDDREEVVRCTLTSVQPNAISYGYLFADDPEVTLPAGPDGSVTTNLTIPADTPSNTSLQLRAWTINTAGTRSDEAATSFFVFQGT